MEHNLGIIASTKLSNLHYAYPMQYFSLKNNTLNPILKYSAH